MVLTDLVKHSSGVDKDIVIAPEDRTTLIAKIEEMKPDLVAFTSKKVAQEALCDPKIQFGLQTKSLKNSLVYVLPSTSPANGHWKNASQHWYQLAELVKQLRGL